MISTTSRLQIITVEKLDLKLLWPFKFVCLEEINNQTVIHSDRMILLQGKQ